MLGAGAANPAPLCFEEALFFLGWLSEFVMNWTSVARGPSATNVAKWC